VKNEDHRRFWASSLNANSHSLPGMISLVDPTTRWHTIIWSSRGSRLAILKYLAAGDGGVSLICSNPSETKTTMANISAASSSYQPISTLIACLVSAASLLNLSSRLTTSVFPCLFASPPLDHILVALVSSPP